MAGEQPLGKAKVEIVADLTQLNAGVEQAKEKVREVGDAASSTQNEAAALWETMKKGAEESAEATEEVVESAGKLNVGLSLVASAGATALAAVVGLLVSAWQKAADAAEEAKKKSKDAFDEAEKAREALTKAFDDAIKPPSAMDKEIESITKKTNDTIEKLNDERRVLGNKKMIDRYNQVTEQIVEAERRLQESIDAIKERYRQQDLTKSNQVTQEARDAALKHIKEESDARAKALQEAARQRLEFEDALAKKLLEQQRIVQRTAEIQARAAIDAQTAMDRLISTQERGFTAQDSGGSIAAQIEAMTDRIVSAVNRTVISNE